MWLTPLPERPASVEPMKAARLHEFGGPDVLRVEDVPWPHPMGDEVLIRVHGSSINGTDLGLRAGGGPFALTTRRPFTVGFDLAGEVVGLGPKVTAFEFGDRVTSLLGHGGGGAAEYVAVGQARVGMAPRSVPLTEAAALPLAGLTALQALRAAAGDQFKEGARVLINGASGGIGAYAVQLAKHFGCFVSGTARAEKLDFVRALGADEVIDSKRADFVSGGDTWDVILDTPPSLSFAQVRPALGESGVLVSTRPFPGDLTTLGGLLSRSGPRYRGVMTRERGFDLTYLARLVDAGAIRIPLDRSFALEQIAAAHRYAGGGEARGKVVVSLV